MSTKERSRAREFARLGVWSAYPARTRPAHGPERWLPATVAAVALLGVWLAATRGDLVPDAFLPDAFAVWDRLVVWTGNGTIWRYLWPTVVAALIGSAIAVVASLVLGILIAHSRLLGAVIEPFVAFSQAIPLVAIAPLLALWIGYGMVPIAVLCALVAFFPMVTTTVVGFRSLDMRMVENAWLDGAGFRARLWHVELPVAAPAILAGIRAGFVLSMTGAIVGEFVIGGAGLGTLLTISREATDTVGVFAVLVWIAAVALVLQGIIQAAEHISVRRLQGETT
ncbi:ABC transporter permease [Tessaracoccus rhinocerotis]|uniref:ABC transporter permease n=1 Tax=Tessaracoccus rhinocerotis TaxID=1689449 RepID=A0A553K262_9ACTN|nr:ABC transporter permease [Tessaracoccus rhinocerotis]TRY18802.1 ABC transporter permease [Tessaracoccus rhinocerotis]